MHRVFFKIASFFAGLSVIIGAFGAHLLKRILEPEALASIQTAVTYQMTHSLAIFIIGMMYRHYATKKVIFSGYFFTIGIILFSGSIYLITMLKYLGFGTNNLLVLLTPLGGLMLILGWFTLMIAVPESSLKYKDTKE